MLVSAIEADGDAAVVAVDERSDTHGRPVLRAAWYFRYDHPVESPSFGTRISVSSSPWPTAVSKTPMKKSAAATVRSPPAPTITISASSASITAGRSEARIAVGERAADRAAVPHLRVTDLAGRRGDDRAVLLEERITRARPHVASSAPIASCEPASRT